MLKISYAACLGLSQSILVQFTLEICLIAQNCQKIHKKPLLLGSSKVTALSTDRKPMYDFLLVIKSNLALFLRYSDLLLNIANFPYPLSFSAITRSNLSEISRKALQILKLESSRQPMVKIW